MSRGRRPPRGVRKASEFPSVIVLMTCCICLSASGSRVTVSVREREVSGTVHQSVLLAASYTPAPYYPLIIEWRLYSNTTPCVTLTRSQCSPHPDGPGYNCSDHLVPSPSHKGRIHLYPDNGSLLLRDLRRSDSGVYVISVYSGGDSSVKDNVTLTVYNETASGSRVAVSVREREVSGTVHQSVLLAASYTPAPYSLLTLVWHLYSRDTPLVKLTRLQCSPHPDGPGYNCSDHLVTSLSHKGRIHLYPDNGSLLLRDLRRSDSGVYVISVYSRGDSSVKDNVTLTVYNETASGSRVAVSVREREVSGTVHQSVLLAASYTPAPYSLLTLVWHLYSRDTPLVKLTRSQCSPHPDGPGYNCSDHLVTSPSHKGRIHLYPDNGSLLLRDLRRSDSGVYVISVYSRGDSSVKDNVTLTVYNETESADPTSPPTTPDHSTASKHRTVLVVGPICLAIILITVCLSLLMIRIHRGRRRLDTIERIVLSNGGSREDLNETRNTEQNLQYETIYSTLQFPLDNSPTTTCGPDAHIIYSTPRKVW